ATTTVKSSLGFSLSRSSKARTRKTKSRLVLSALAMSFSSTPGGGGGIGGAIGAGVVAAAGVTAGAAGAAGIGGAGFTRLMRTALGFALFSAVCGKRNLASLRIVLPSSLVICTVMSRESLDLLR